MEQEAEAPDFLARIEAAPRRFASAVGVYETGIVLGARRGAGSTVELMGFLDALGVEIVPFAEPAITGALDALACIESDSMCTIALEIAGLTAQQTAQSMSCDLR